MSLNKCLIIGNLGKDPEMRYTSAGVAVTKFSVAVNHNTRDEAGEWKEETEWFNVVLFRESAERAADRLRKGTKVFAEGRLQTRKYEKDGQTRYFTELLADRFLSLDPRQRDEDGGDDIRAARPAAAAPAARADAPAPPGDDFDDPIPF